MASVVVTTSLCGSAAILDEQTKPARDVVSEQAGKVASVVGKVAGKIAEQPAVQAAGRATMNTAEALLDAHEKIDRRAQEIEQKVYDSRVGKQVREAFGEDLRPQGPVEGKPIDSESMGIAIR